MVLTACESFKDPRFIEQLNMKGIHRFIAYDLPVDLVKRKYGVHFEVVMGDLKQSDDLRVLDYEGRRAFYSFPLDLLKDPVYHEEQEILHKAA